MKETVMKILRRIALVFDGTKECHAKLDQAVQRSEEVRRRALRVYEETGRSHGNGDVPAEMARR